MEKEAEAPRERESERAGDRNLVLQSTPLPRIPH